MSAGTERFPDDAEMAVELMTLIELTTFFGSEFQVEEATAGKARLPTAESLV